MKHFRISGHNRQRAAIAAGISKGPVIVKKRLSDEEAAFIIAETNLCQRGFTDMRHSERAYCLKQYYNAVKKQGKRTDLIEKVSAIYSDVKPQEMKENATSCQVGTKSKRSNEQLGKEYGLSARTVARYIRIAELNSYFMNLLDEGILPFMAAYNIAFISKDKQMEIADILKVNQDFRVDIKKAEKLRVEFENGRLIPEKIKKILTDRKPVKKPKPMLGETIKLKPAVVKEYFSKAASQKEIEEIVEKALRKYFSDPE